MEGRARRSSRWLILLLAVTSLMVVGYLARDLLTDRRIRLRTLITMDPPPGPDVTRVGPHSLSVTGATTRELSVDRLALWAWSPTPTIRVIAPGGPGRITLDIDNVPAGVDLDASGPAGEDRRGRVRSLRFSPDTTRRLTFRREHPELTFAVLGDTGASPTFVEALRVAAVRGAQFMLHLGDLIQHGDDQIPDIDRILRTAPIPVYVVRGNHDYRHRRRIEFMRALGPPYYAFEVSGATFIVLDNAGRYVPPFWRRSTQYRWLKGMLGLPRTGPLFLAMHKQLFERRPGRDAHSAAIQDGGWRFNLMRDFAAAGVDAVFTGHANGSFIWYRDQIPYVISGEGTGSPDGARAQRMGWVKVRGWDVTVQHVPIWEPATG